MLGHLAGAHGIDHAVAWVAAENRAWTALFERLGFAVAATERGTVEHRYERSLLAG